jgi:hypothetical protein
MLLCRSDRLDNHAVRCVYESRPKLHDARCNHFDLAFACCGQKVAGIVRDNDRAPAIASMFTLCGSAPPPRVTAGVFKRPLGLHCPV